MVHIDTKIQRSISVLCWNIGNPSPERAAKQALWLRKQEADALVLTECKQSKGCAFLEKYFRAYGYNVVFPKPEGNEYGVAIVSKHQMELTELSLQVNYLRSRIVSVLIMVPNMITPPEIVGVYVPSRDASIEKKHRKRHFLGKLLTALEKVPDSEYRIFCGDLNLLEPNHIPHYAIFEDWEYRFYSSLSELGLTDLFRHYHSRAQEYSWVGRTGEGYRYDHFFVGPKLLRMADDCRYLHEPRLENLSDHSALVAIFIPESMEAEFEAKSSH